MLTSEKFLNPSQAARRLGVSAKALRLYEQHGLLKPTRSAAGWRTYGPAEMARAAEIVALRALGLSLAQVGRALRGDSEDLEPALAVHQTALEDRVRQLADAVEKVRILRADLAQGRAPTVSELVGLVQPAGEVRIAFDLPWPWGGERFELRHVSPLSYITGPLASGKTRLAAAIAENLPKAAFVGLDRLAEEGAAARAKMNADSVLKARVDQILSWLIEDGATQSSILVALVVALESEGPTSLVVDMVEQGLDHATQEALMAYLRHNRSAAAPSLFLLTRSSVILDLAAVGPDETILFCPANHSPPTRVLPYPGAPGFEAVATCLALPEVRARTEGVIATRRH